MKALTVRQPHASLVALNLKPIETRSWATKYRGPLLIHAGAAAPKEQDIGPWHVWNESGYVWWLDGRKGDPESANYFPCPLGAIVASCKLVDCVPIVGPLDEEEAIPHALVVDDGLALFHDNDPFAIGLDAQLPYGDFTPGRYAWLLEDIKPVEQRCPACWGSGLEALCGRTDAGSDGPCVLRAGGDHICYGPGDVASDWTPANDCRVCEGAMVCEPVPAKGKQGLWNWNPGEAA